MYIIGIDSGGGVNDGYLHSGEVESLGDSLAAGRFNSPGLALKLDALWRVTGIAFTLESPRSWSLATTDAAQELYLFRKKRNGQRGPFSGRLGGKVLSTLKIWHCPAGQSSLETPPISPVQIASLIQLSG